MSELASHAPEGARYTPEGIDDAFAGDNPVLPQLGPAGWLRWTWRQLSSMRVALLLLMLLAVAALVMKWRFRDGPATPKS